MAVAAANMAVESGDQNNLLNSLMNPDILLHSVTSQCGQQYLSSLKLYKDQKAATGIVFGSFLGLFVRELIMKKVF